MNHGLFDLGEWSLDKIVLECLRTRLRKAGSTVV